MRVKTNENQKSLTTLLVCVYASKFLISGLRWWDSASRVVSIKSLPMSTSTKRLSVVKYHIFPSTDRSCHQVILNRYNNEMCYHKRHEETLNFMPSRTCIEDTVSKNVNINNQSAEALSQRWLSSVKIDACLTFYFSNT